MAKLPRDPAAETVNESQRATNTFEGQQGPGVDFEHDRFVGQNLDDPAGQGRSGSYETNNQGRDPRRQPDPETPTP